jgi:predicted CXXCH cytochrome family protein
MMHKLAWIGILLTLAFFIMILAVAQSPSEWDDCQSCHKDKFEGSSRYMHPQVAGCEVCHTSHDRDKGKLLLADEIVLCQEPCHTDLGRSHSTGRNLRNPTTDELQDVTCTNRCHDPHGSDYKAILRVGAKELCTSCHDL